MMEENIFNQTENENPGWTEIVVCSVKFFGFPDEVASIKKAISDHFEGESFGVLFEKYDLENQTLKATIPVNGVETGINILYELYDFLDNNFPTVSFEYAVKFAKIDNQEEI